MQNRTARGFAQASTAIFRISAQTKERKTASRNASRDPDLRSRSQGGSSVASRSGPFLASAEVLKDDEHLAHLNESEHDSVLNTFVRGALLGVPGARKNSMFGFNPPSFVLALRRRGHPLSLVNAFEKPIKARGDGYIEPSKKALLEHLEQLCGVYGL
ncbi:MAG TPA: type I-E CRISPR-associated protein Cas7/Cse4/CasC, partial [Vicinamibacterales bacterium]|nr:type I-E CRISPR-associated protein Cas7/Cse4/CasC [Vicinamibacterales bacterium]